MNRLILWVIVAWLVILYFRQRKTIEQLNNRLLALEKPSIRPAFTRELISTSNGGYNDSEIDQRFSGYIPYFEVNTYEDAKQLAVGSFPRTIRVSNDSNANGSATTYDYWPDSLETDKLEQANF